MQPEAFDGVQERTVGRQPEHMKVVIEQTESRTGCCASMVGRVVHDQDDFLRGIAVGEQMVKEHHKRLAVLVWGGCP